MATKDAYLRQLFIGVPISLIFMLFVFGSQIGLQWIKWEVGDAGDPDREVPIAWKYLPGIINSILIIVFGQIYIWLSGKLVEDENHRYVSSFENSMINKIYMFQFINTYISNFVIILYNQNFGTLTINLIIVMVFKQVFMNLLEFY